MSTTLSRPDSPRLSWDRLRAWRPEISSEMLILAASLFFALACNSLFWRSAMAANPGSVMFALSLFALLVGVHALLLSVLLWRWNAKVLLTLLFITTATAPWTGRLTSSSAKQSDLSNSPLWQAVL